MWEGKAACSRGRSPLSRSTRWLMDAIVLFRQQTSDRPLGIHSTFSSQKEEKAVRKKHLGVLAALASLIAGLLLGGFLTSGPALASSAHDCPQPQSIQFNQPVNGYICVNGDQEDVYYFTAQQGITVTIMMSTPINPDGSHRWPHLRLLTMCFGPYHCPPGVKDGQDVPGQQTNSQEDFVIKTAPITYDGGFAIRAGTAQEGPYTLLLTAN
jgi:hypothetical protein